MSATKSCPYCAELIQVQAKYCKHCKKDLKKTNESQPILTNANPTFLSRVFKRWYIHLLLFPISLPIEYLSFISQPNQVEKRRRKAEQEKGYIESLPEKEKEAYLEKKEPNKKNAIRLSLVVLFWLMLGSVAFMFYFEPDYPYQVCIGFLLLALGIWLHPMKGEGFFRNRLAKVKEHKVRLGLTVVAFIGGLIPFINLSKQAMIENYPEPTITILSKEGDLGEASEYELKVRAEDTESIRVEGEGEMKPEVDDTYVLTLDLEELSNTFNIIAENEYKQSDMSLVVTRDETEVEKEQRLTKEAEEEQKRLALEAEAEEKLKEEEKVAQEAQAKALGVSYDQVMGHNLSQFFSMEKTPPLSDGRDKYSGLSNNELVLLEIIGSKENISEATFIIFIDTSNPNASIENAALAFRFFMNIFPSWTDSQVWLNDTIESLQTDLDGEIETVREGKLIKASYEPVFNSLTFKVSAE